MVILEHPENKLFITGLKSYPGTLAQMALAWSPEAGLEPPLWGEKPAKTGAAQRGRGPLLHWSLKESHREISVLLAPLICQKHNLQCGMLRLALNMSSGVAPI